MIKVNQMPGNAGKQNIRSLAARRREKMPETMPTYLKPPYDDIEYCIAILEDFQESYNELQLNGWEK